MLFTLTLPHIPVAKQQANQSWTTMLGLDAFALFKNKRMAIFFIFSMLLGAELQITNMFGNTFLHSFDKDPMFASSFIVQHASIIMSISQISETLFILTIPFFLSRYGIKNVMMISIVAWILRFGAVCLRRPDSVRYCTAGTVDDRLRLRIRLLQHLWFGVCRERSSPGNPRQRTGDVPDDDQRLRLYPRRHRER